jgi:nitrate reductase gamma subunit
MQIALGLILGMAIIAGAFWFTFRRVPERRSDGGLVQHDAANYASYVERDVNGDQHR